MYIYIYMYGDIYIYTYVYIYIYIYIYILYAHFGIELESVLMCCASGAAYVSRRMRGVPIFAAHPRDEVSPHEQSHAQERSCQKTHAYTHTVEVVLQNQADKIRAPSRRPRSLQRQDQEGP